MSDGYREHPGWNQSSAVCLLNNSPRHALEKRKRAMGPHFADPDHSRTREIGTVIHKLLLGSDREWKVLDYQDYKTRKAQDDREECEETGVTPILKCDLEKATCGANRLREQLSEVFGITLDGESEIPLYWTEHIGNGNYLQCKARLDHVRKDGVTIIDVKSGDSANPRGLTRRILECGYHIQAAAYTRALAANFSGVAGRTRFLDIFIETAGLTMCTPVEIEGSMYELGERQWLKSCRRWYECAERGVYPGYTETVLRPEPPKYALEQEMLEG